MKITRTRQMMHIALLSAISFVLYLFEVPVFQVLQMDFSDVPVLVGTLVFNPIVGISIAFIKNAFHFIFKSGDFIGVLANFGFAFSVIIPLALSKKVSKRLSYLVLILGIPFTAGLMHAFNYFVTFPLYYGSMNQELNNVLINVFLPTNMAKAAVLYAIIILIREKIKLIYKDIL